MDGSVVVAREFTLSAAERVGPGRGCAKKKRDCDVLLPYAAHEYSRLKPAVRICGDLL